VAANSSPHIGQVARGRAAVYVSVFAAPAHAREQYFRSAHALALVYVAGRRKGERHWAQFFTSGMSIAPRLAWRPPQAREQ
jgi:hypothetical protein